MLDNPLNAADIAWPTDLVYAIDRTTIIGCQIPRAVQTKQLKSLLQRRFPAMAPWASHTSPN